MLTHRRYEPGEVLGQGAQGTVLRVVDRESPRRALVAKVWAAGAGRFDATRIGAEFALLARLRIVGLVRAHDFGFDERTRAPFFVEDFATGVDLTEYLQRADDATERAKRLRRIFADTTQTLDALHAAGFVHGDLKPAHVRVGDDGRAVIVDLGAAVLRGARSLGHTAGFVAPEVLAGAATSPGSDLYALGATMYAAAAGAMPDGTPLRARAPFVPAGVAEVILRCLSPHPVDRPPTARDVLAALGRQAGPEDRTGARPGPVGRDADLRALLAEDAPTVRYVVGPSGAGKSFLLEEAVTAALLDGRQARSVRFPTLDATLVARLLAFFRGASEAWPFAVPPTEPTLLALDALTDAPRELGSALEAYRCRPQDHRVHVIAVATEAPPGASALVLGPLDRGSFHVLCTRLEIDDVEAAWRVSEGLPGWATAFAGRVPVGTAAVLERVRGQDDAAKLALAAAALLRGVLRRPVATALGVPDGALATLLAQGLFVRRGDEHALAAEPFAKALAEPLASCAIVDRVADALLDVEASAQELWALAHAPYPPTKRALLLGRAIELARRDGLRVEETESLLELMATPRERSSARLLRLERLTRDTANVTAQSQALAWLVDAAERDPALEGTALRRRAERAARSGDHVLAGTLAERALAVARGDATATAYALATRGAAHLFAAAWKPALRCFVEARSILASQPSHGTDDAEEGARLDHNLGVVALYENELDRSIEAFRRSLTVKRALGDSAGVRSCLLNLGLALARTKAFDEGARTLDEGAALARSLGQSAGLAWCLVARADLEARRARPKEADRFASDAMALADALPPALRSDLALVRARIAILEGHGAEALREIASLERETRQEDALTDARALVLEAQARMLTLPIARHTAARCAIAAIRRARAAALPELEGDATAALRAARGRGTVNAGIMTTFLASEDPLWDLLVLLPSEPDAFAALGSLAASILRETRAERAFVIVAGAVVLGLDVDGLPLADAERRFPQDARDGTAGVTYLRDVETPAGHGSRLMMVQGAAPRTVLVLEHRFATGQFDGVPEALALRWGAVVALLARGLGAGATPVQTASHLSARGPAKSSTPASTVLPHLESTREFPAIVGRSLALRRALARLEAALESDLPVLISGETGVGKELFARALHDQGPRARAPFVALNCAAVPEALLEAELFGHTRGSFTGADRARAGLLARAEGGTLFLDEIGELALPRQATLLRALETRRFRAVGSDEERAFDVRIVSATNRDLEQEVEKGAFRRDLLYRLRVLDLLVPPLRDRPEDLPLLIQHFLGGAKLELSPRAMDALAAHAWPGNVRELSHQVQRLLALRVKRVDLEHLSRELRGALRSLPPAAKDERGEVALALEATGGNISHAAERLGLTRHGLKKRMVRLGMRSKSS